MQKAICWADGPGTDVGEMQIHSSGTDAAVAQQFLDREQIGSILQQMRGKCMAQTVYRNIFVNVGGTQPFL